MLDIQLKDAALSQHNIWCIILQRDIDLFKFSEKKKERISAD